MAKRKTVSIDVAHVQSIIKSKCRSYAAFCELMGRPTQRTWVTEWNRNKNLPSPEETVKMCEILSVKPEEILTSPKDVALVQSLMKEKDPAAQMGSEAENMNLSELQRKLIQLSFAMSNDLLEREIAYLEKRIADDSNK